MSPYDLAMVGVVIAGMIWGAFRGITWQLASMASLVLGYAVSFPASAQLAPHFPGEPIVARALAMLTLYVAVSGGIFLLAWSVRAVLRRWQFEAYDRHLGMVLGGLEGAILGMVATVFVISLAPQTRGPILGSTSGRVVGGLLDAVQPALPGEVRSMLAAHWAGPTPTDRPAGEGAKLRTTLADDIKSSVRDEVGRAEAEATDTAATRPDGPPPTIEGAVSGLIERGAAVVEREIRKDLPPGVTTAADGEAPADASPIKGLLKEQNEKLARRMRSRLGADDTADPRTLKGLLKKSGARIGQAVTDTISDEIDQLGEKSDGRKIERR